MCVGRVGSLCFLPLLGYQAKFWLRSCLLSWSGSKMFSKGCKLTYQEMLPLIVTLPQPHYSVLNLLPSNTSHLYSGYLGLIASLSFARQCRLCVR